MAKGQGDICKKLPFPILLISVETQEMPEGWVHQHRLVCISQIELPQLRSSAHMPDSINKFMKFLVGDMSFIWTEERIYRVAAKGMRQVVNQSKFT